MWQFAGKCVLLNLRQRKNASSNPFQVPLEMLKNWEKTFKMLHFKLKKGQSLNEDEEKTYNQIVYVNDFQVIGRWVSHVAIVIEKEEKAEKQRKSQKGLMGFLWGKKAEEPEKSQDYEALFAEIQSMSDPPFTHISSSTPWLKIVFTLESCHCSLHRAHFHDGVSLTSHSIQVQTLLAGEGFSLDMSVENCLWELTQVSDVGETRYPFCTQSQSSGGEKIISIHHEQYPATSEITSLTQVRSQSVDLVFVPQVVELISQFFDVSDAEQSVKTMAWDTVQEITDSTNEKLAELLHSEGRRQIELDLAAPVVFINLDNASKLRIALGSFLIANSSAGGDAGEHYEVFHLSVPEVKVDYEAEERHYPVLEPLTFNAKAMFLKSAIKRLKYSAQQTKFDGLPNIVLSGGSEPVILNLTLRIYREILGLIEKSTSLSHEAMANLALEKEKFLKSAVIAGYLWQNSGKSKGWNSVFSVVSGAYIYCYPAEDQLTPGVVFYLKDCSLTEVLREQNFEAFKLTNRYGECLLSFANRPQRLQWETAISDTISTLRTGVISFSLSPKHTTKPVISLEASMPLVEVKLTNWEVVSWLNLKIRDIHGSVVCRPYELQLAAALKSLEIEDLRLDKQMRSLAKSIDDGQGLIDVKGEFVDAKSQNFQWVEKKMDVKFRRMKFNWNQETLFELFNFLQYQPTTSIPQSIQSSKGSPTINLHLTIGIEVIDISLNNVQNCLPIFQISIERVACDYIIKEKKAEFSGTLGNAALYDTTDYPRTAAKNWKRGKKFCLFSILEGCKQLLEFKLVLLDEGSEEITTEFATFLDVTLSSAKLVYLHQPISRLVDFFDQRILPLFDSAARLKDLSQSPYVSEYSLVLQASTIKKSSTVKRYTKVRIKAENGLVHVVPRPLYPFFFVVDLGTIEVENKILENTARYTEAITVDSYTITGRRIRATCDKSEIAEPVDLTISFERPLLSPDQQFLPGLDASYAIYGACNALLFNFTQFQYMLLLKIFDLNFGYDDHMEWFVNPDTPMYQQVENDPKHLGAYIRVQLQVNQISFLVKQEEEAIAELITVHNRLGLVRYNDKFVEMDLTSKTAQLFLPGEEEKTRTSLASHIAETVFNAPLQMVTGNRLPVVVARPIDEQSSIQMLTVHLDKPWTNNKSLIVGIYDVGVFMDWAFMEVAINFFSCGVPEYVNETETPNDYRNKYQPELSTACIEAEELLYAPKIEFVVSVINPFVVFPANEGTRVLVSQGNLQFTYYREHEYECVKNSNIHIEAKRSELVWSQLELFSVRADALNSVSALKLATKRKIVTQCEFGYRSVLETKGKQAIKEYINFHLSKLHVIASLNDIKQGYQSYLFQSSAMEHSKELIEVLGMIQKQHNLRGDDFESFLARFSTISARRSVVVQRERTGSVVDRGAPGHKRSLSNPDLIQPEEDSLVVETQYSVPDLKLTLINDSTGAYGPLLSTQISLPVAKELKTANDIILLVELIGKMDYYNPYIDSWEPLIESFDGNFQNHTRQHESPKSQITVTLGARKSILINFSEALALHLHKLMTMWKFLGSEPSAEEFSEQISPFSIENEFGSAIIVETPNRGTQVINSGVIAPYEIDIEGERVFSVPSQGLSITLTYQGSEVATLEGISLKKTKCISRYFKHGGDRYPVLLETKLVDTRKILTVRSPIVFKNELNVDVHLFFPFSSPVCMSECKSGKTCPVPFLFTAYCIGVLPLTFSDSTPLQLDLSRLLSLKTSQSYELHSDQFFFEIQVLRHRSNSRKFTLRILPPLKIRNLLPCPMLVCLVHSKTRLQTPWQRVEKGEDWTVHDFAKRDEVAMALRVKDSEMKRPVVMVTKDPAETPKAVLLLDGESNELELMVGCKDRGCRILSIYACIALVNYTKLPLSFYTKRRGKLRKVPPQEPTEPILCSPCKKIIAELGDQRSNIIRADVAGARSFLSIKTHVSAVSVALFQFTYNVDIAWPRPEKYFFTRTVTISPKIILANQLPVTICVAQCRDTSGPMVLQPGERNIFYWPNCEQEEKVIVRPLEDKEEMKKALRGETTRWEWSGDFSVDKVGTTVVQCWDRISQFFIISAEVRLEDFASVVVFTGEDVKFNQYTVDNKSSNLTLAFYQKDCNDHRRFLGSMTSMPIGWSRPSYPRTLHLELYQGSFSDIPVFLARYQINMDKLTFYREVKIKTSSELGYMVYIRVHSVGTAVVLEIGDGSLSRNQSDEQEEEKIDQQIHLLIPSLGISLIESHPPNVRELVFMEMQGVECMVESGAVTRTTELKIAGMQVDNQYNTVPMYPVLMFQQPESEKSLDIFKLLTVVYLEDNPTLASFREISVQLQTINLRVESILVQKIVALYLRSVKQMKLWTDEEEVDLLYRKEGPERITSPKWMTKELTISKKRLYIEDMHLLPIKVIFSFMTLKDEDEEKEDSEVIAILQSRKMVMLSIDSATVKFPSCDLSQVYMSQRKLKKVVTMHYEERLKQEVFRLIWHTDILGSPMNFLNCIGTAVFDLVNEPVQGIVNGPLEGGKGLIKGAGSFLKNSVSATFGSVSKITGSVATGITALTQGKEGLLERQREKARDRPKDAFEGVMYGMKSIAMGIGKGVAGVVTEPVKGAKKGTKGFFSGMVRGIAGIVGKPVAGVFDAVSKTAEGINNTANPVDALGSQRTRLPRVTYGPSHRIRKYRASDSEVYEDIITLKPDFIKLSFCYHDSGTDLSTSPTLVVLYYERIIVFSLEGKSIIWESDIEDLGIVEAAGLRNSVSFRRKPGKRGEQRAPFVFIAPSSESQRKMVAKVRAVISESSFDS